MPSGSMSTRVWKTHILPASRGWFRLAKPSVCAIYFFWVLTPNVSLSYERRSYQEFSNFKSFEGLSSLKVEIRGSHDLTWSSWRTNIRYLCCVGILLRLYTCLVFSFSWLTRLSLIFSLISFCAEVLVLKPLRTLVLLRSSFPRWVRRRTRKVLPLQEFNGMTRTSKLARSPDRIFNVRIRWIPSTAILAGEGLLIHQMPCPFSTERCKSLAHLVVDES